RSISGMTGTIGGYNGGATKEPGEPNHAANVGGHSVWYCWTPPASGTVIFDTAGSDFQTVLGVYTGNSVDALLVVADDNGSGPNQISRLNFSAVANTPYHIAVDGFAGAMGKLVLNWSTAA